MTIDEFLAGIVRLVLVAAAMIRYVVGVAKGRASAALLSGEEETLENRCSLLSSCLRR